MNWQWGLRREGKVPAGGGCGGSGGGEIEGKRMRKEKGGRCVQDKERERETKIDR